MLSTSQRHQQLSFPHHMVKPQHRNRRPRISRQPWFGSRGCSNRFHSGRLRVVPPGYNRPNPRLASPALEAPALEIPWQMPALQSCLLRSLGPKGLQFWGFWRLRARWQWIRWLAVAPHQGFAELPVSRSDPWSLRYRPERMRELQTWRIYLAPRAHSHCRDLPRERSITLTW